MNSTIFTSLKKCFNITFTGWKNKNDRMKYQQKLLEEYPVIGGEAFTTFSRVMELETNPNEFLTAYFSLLKEIQATVDADGGLRLDKFTTFFEKARKISSDFSQKYRGWPKEKAIVVDIAVLLLKLYAQMILPEPVKKAG